VIATFAFSSFFFRIFWESIAEEESSLMNQWQILTSSAMNIATMAIHSEYVQLPGGWKILAGAARSGATGGAMRRSPWMTGSWGLGGDWLLASRMI
jgi:hypothetical protein